jgi:hypothetical protein
LSRPLVVCFFSWLGWGAGAGAWVAKRPQVAPDRARLLPEVGPVVGLARSLLGCVLPVVPWSGGGPRRLDVLVQVEHVGWVVCVLERHQSGISLLAARRPHAARTRRRPGSRPPPARTPAIPGWLLPQASGRLCGSRPSSFGGEGASSLGGASLRGLSGPLASPRSRSSTPTPGYALTSRMAFMGAASQAQNARALFASGRSSRCSNDLVTASDDIQQRQDQGA